MCYCCDALAPICSSLRDFPFEDHCLGCYEEETSNYITDEELYSLLGDGFSAVQEGPPVSAPQAAPPRAAPRERTTTAGSLPILK